MSAELSTVAFPDPGMQKTLTRRAGCGRASSMHTPAVDPVSLMVRAGPCPKAPDVLCLQVLKSPLVHWLLDVHGCAGDSKAGANC